MPRKNRLYTGPEIQVKLYRGTNVFWQIESIRNGFLISNAQREQYKNHKDGGQVYPFDLDTNAQFKYLSDRELRNLHSSASCRTSETPNSKYVSLTSFIGDANWGQGTAQTIIFRFDIWRSDVWKGAHEIIRNPEGLEIANHDTKRAQRFAVMLADTPPDWDRGREFEWLALGGTRISNVEESQNGGTTWTPSTSTRPCNFNEDWANSWMESMRK